MSSHPFNEEHQLFIRMITLTLTQASLKENLLLVKEAKDSIRLVELRGDFLDPSFIVSDVVLNELSVFVDELHALNLEVIFTLRQDFDRGHFKGSPSEALLWYTAAVQAGFDYIDIDEQLFSSKPFLPMLKNWRNCNGVQIVVSRHDFEKIPDDFLDWLKAIDQKGFIPKIAVAIKSPKELVLFYQLCLKASAIKKVVVGMGALALITRILTKHFGSLWSYTSFSKETAKLGHISPIELDKIYRYYEITKEWEIYGIIGNPVMNSKSPQIQNEFFKTNNLSKIYIPFQTEDFYGFQEVIKAFKIKGLSVTVPFKEEAAKIATVSENSIASIKAANTLLFHEDQIYAYNSDVEGFSSPLLALLKKKQFQVCGCRVALIGAGGASRAIIYALKGLGANLFLFNRSYEKAVSMVNEFCYGKAYPLTHLCEFDYFDIVINSSTAGMGELAYLDPSSGYEFKGNEIVYDIVYYPANTKLLLRAKEAGCSTIGGIKMLEAQALRQSKLFGYGVELKEERT